MIYYYLISNFVLDINFGIGFLFVRCFLLTAPMDIALSVAAVFLSRKLRRFMPS